MASKLDAFLAVMPANACVRSPPKSAPAMLTFQSLESMVAPDVGSFTDKTPQPPMAYHSCLQLCKYNSILNLALDDKSSSQIRPHDDRNISGPSPLTLFINAHAGAAMAKSYTKKHEIQVLHFARHGGGTNLNAKSEADPMHMASVQGLHKRRVSTDTTLLDRCFSQLDIRLDSVQYFATVPVITATSGVTEALQSELNIDNNADEEHTSADLHGLNPEKLIAIFRAGNTISVSSAIEIVRRATTLMSLEQNVISLRAPYTLVGDLHGQFQDLLGLFRVHGFPAADNPFLFLGDYVDRGIASCEIILLLLLFKVAFPECVHLLRGNHECRSLSTFYGFRAECLKKYGPVLYNRMITCFESMPLAARLDTVHGSFLVVHGGLSPDIQYVEDINGQVNRFMEPAPNGALCDLLWSDPAKGETQELEWVPNRTRGCSFTFNESACREFLKRNNLLAIIRAHELEEDGYKEHFRQNLDRSEVEADENLVLPAVVTVFSAPEYCNTNHNVGATLKIPWEKQNGRLLQYQQHKRSHYAENKYNHPSEEKAVKDFLVNNLPFLPIEFYDLVNLCRQMRLSLERTASNSSCGNELNSKQSAISPLYSPATSIENEDKVENSKISVAPHSIDRSIEFRSIINDVCHTSEIDKASGDSLQAGKLVCKTECSVAPANKAKKCPKEICVNGEKKVIGNRHKWNTSRLVSGFARICDRYFASDSTNQREASALDCLGSRVSWIKAPFKRSNSNGEALADSRNHEVATVATGPVRRKSMTDWLTMPSLERGLNQITTKHSNNQVESDGVNVFTKAQWQALKLYFSILDLDGSGLLMEESFVVLLAEQDSDAYATEDELSLLLEVMDCNADKLITEQDFLFFARSAMMRWKKDSSGANTDMRRPK